MQLRKLSKLNSYHTPGKNLSEADMPAFQLLSEKTLTDETFSTTAKPTTVTLPPSTPAIDVKTQNKTHTHVHK